MNSNYPNWQQGYNGYGGYNTPSYGQPTSNVIRVTSLDEAIMRTSVRNSEMVYFDQDKNVFYIVKVDMNDRKTWQEFPYTVPNQDNAIPASKADMQALLERITALEAKVGMEVSNNG